MKRQFDVHRVMNQRGLMNASAVITRMVLALAAPFYVGCVGTTTASPEVSGHVVDASTRKAIPAATIQIAERPRTLTHSDARGAFIVPADHSFHLAFIPGPCAWTYFPPERPYCDRLVVAHPGYATREFHAVSISRTPPSSRDPERIKTADIELRHQ
jgi:hypothetical protein